MFVGNIILNKANESTNKEIDSIVNENVTNYDTLSESDKGEIGVILDKTLCYSTQGGQISDKAIICTKNFNFNINNVKKINGYVIHYGKLIQTDLRYVFILISTIITFINIVLLKIKKKIYSIENALKN